MNNPSMITEDELKAMGLICEGADVLCYEDAVHLRRIEHEYPCFIFICQPMSQYNVHERPAYFGAILTATGRAYYREHMVAA